MRPRVSSATLSPFPFHLLIFADEDIVTVTGLPLANINITIPLDDFANVNITPRVRFPPQLVTLTNDPNPLKESGVTHPPVTRTVTLPPWPQGTVMYIPPRDYENYDNSNDDDTGSDEGDDDNNNDDDNNTDDDNEDDDNGDDDEDDIDLPPIPIISVSDGPGRPECADNCPSPCSDPFCLCIFCPGAGGDSGFADPSDPNPPPKPSDPGSPNNEGDPTSCTSSSSATNYWVSCETEEDHPISTSCTTTSSMVVVGCEVTGTTTTTGVEVCYSVDPNENQGQDGTGISIPTVSATATTTTSTSTAISATTTHTPTNLPTSPEDLQFVLFALDVKLDGKSTWTWEGMVLPDPTYDPNDVCSFHYSVLTSIDFSRDDSFPDTLGRFSAAGLTGCYYESDNEAGNVICNEAKLPCVGLDALHTTNNPGFECSNGAGIDLSFWQQAWCPLSE